MGNKNSNDNNNQNNDIDPLTNNPQYQEAYRNLYSNTSDMPLYPGSYTASGVGTSLKQPRLEVKKTQAVYNDFHIDKTSMSLIKAPELGSFYLKFKFSAKSDVVIGVFYNGRDIVDTSNNTEYIYVDETLPPVQSFIFSVGANQEFPPNKSVINTKKYPTDILTTYTSDRYPLIIKMELKTDNTNQINKVFYTYVTFSISKEGFAGKVLKQKLQIGNKSFVLDDIYGIGTSGLKDPNAPEVKDCAICLTSRIDTVVLPCKHMCLCFECAQNLRTKSSNKCPLCRNNVESFVKLESMTAQ